jgi:hypothetical protein
MSNLKRSIWLASWILLAAGTAHGSDPIRPLMPGIKDTCRMWWRDGFPPDSPGARPHRCIVSGTYGLVFDVGRISLPHFGALSSDKGLEGLSPADLSLTLEVDGKTYRCGGIRKWDRTEGPRLIESGRFLQRTDVTGLLFTSPDGSVLPVDASFELAAWPDFLAMKLQARPDAAPIAVGEASFGRVGGGFGLDGTNHFEIPPVAHKGPFTIEFRVFVPPDYRAGKRRPWLMCRAGNENQNGHYGIAVDNDGVPLISLNIGGGGENLNQFKPGNRDRLSTDRWHHLALTYDGRTARFFMDGTQRAEKSLDQPWPANPAATAFGRRQDGNGGPSHFRGVVDEIRIHDTALDADRIRMIDLNPAAAPKPPQEWCFDPRGIASQQMPRASWPNAVMTISIRQNGKVLESSTPFSGGSPDTFGVVTLVIDPARFDEPPASEIGVRAEAADGGAPLEVKYEPTPGWHRVSLDDLPIATSAEPIDAMERARLLLTNQGDTERVVKLMFEKTAEGLRGRPGQPITGISAVLRDTNAEPTGIPVQFSKNWHSGGTRVPHDGQWFHGISQVRLPPRSETKLELVLSYARWGGLPAVSHSQLSLIGWGTNTLWEQSALGSWGESVCYDPEQTLADSTITDVRPMMVAKTPGDRWTWTSNVGGGDFFRIFDQDGKRIHPGAIVVDRIRNGPCLSEVRMEGKTGASLTHCVTASLGRTDDIVRAVYQVRLDVSAKQPFSRMALFQIGSETYHYARERRFAVGDESGVKKEWAATWGGDVDRTEPLVCPGRVPWGSLHDAVSGGSTPDKSSANRGWVIREWKARLGGRDARPWVVERGVGTGENVSSILSIVPPPQVNELLPGDHVEAVIEMLVIPCSAGEYYGPNEALRQALHQHGGSWEMVHREVLGNMRVAEVSTGRLERIHPDIRVAAQENIAGFTLRGGVAFVPVTVTGLSRPDGFHLLVDGKPLDQSVHGNDFWQTDWSPIDQTWSQTFNVPASAAGTIRLRFESRP